MPRIHGPPPGYFWNFRNFRHVRDFARFPEFLRLRTMCPEAGREYEGSGLRGGRIRGVAIGTSPGPISGANSLRVSILRGREQHAQDPWAPHQGFSGSFEVSEISPDFQNFCDFGTCAPNRVASTRVPGSGGSDSGGRDQHVAGPDFGGKQLESLDFSGSRTGCPGSIDPPPGFF